MDILDHPVNKRIVSGYFPSEELFPEPTLESKNRIHGITSSLSSINALGENKLFQTLFINARNRIREIEMIGNNDGYTGNLVNAEINTLYELDYLDIETIQVAVNMIPFVTELDKILWYNAYMCNFGSIMSNEKKTYELSYAWIYLFRIIQDKEIQTQRTINVDRVIQKKASIIDVINGNWNKKWNRFVRNLSGEESAEFNRLKEQRSSLVAQFKAKKEEEYIVARKTDKEWATFLRIVNDLARKESALIEKIIQPISKKEKINAIYDYQSIVTGLDKLHYTLDGDEIELAEIFYKVLHRFSYAQYYCRVSMRDDIDSFILTPAIYNIGSKARTFNFLYITFHQFRLAPKKDNALLFFSEALRCIKNNLKIEVEKESHSLEGAISAFSEIVIAFFQKNREAIDQISFDQLQSDSAKVDISFPSEMMSDYYYDEFKASIERTAADIDAEAILVKGKIIQPASEEKVRRQVSGIEAEIDRIDAHVNARQIVTSLNIIYMFCDALRITVSNDGLRNKLKNPDRLNKYRLKLREIDGYLVQKVYSSMSHKQIGILEYREQKGIDTGLLAEQEKREEELRTQGFLSALRDSVTALIQGIESKNSEELIEIKSRIREEIYNYPSCDVKEEFALWLDDISERICKAQIENTLCCDDSFDSFKSEVLKGLGAESKKLPESTINALATAEILFQRYVKNEYADKGFDYSSVSSLYYQAFEDVYNELVWRGYAEMLNSLYVEGQLYTDILKSCQNGRISVREASGYLDPDPKNRKFYVDYANQKNPITKVKTRCMYGSFAILMQNIKERSPLNKFCDYFASITGFDNAAEMLSDVVFMEECNRFTRAVETATDNRNNASHGGSAINCEQCRQDKRTVIDELTEVRNDSIGLIQQLLFLLK